MLQPAPYPDSDRLDRIYRATAQNSRGGIAPADYLDLKAEMNGYGEIAAYAGSDMSLSEPGKPAEMAAKIAQGRVNKEYFQKEVLLEQPFYADLGTKTGEYASKNGIAIVGYATFIVGSDASEE